MSLTAAGVMGLIGLISSLAQGGAAVGKSIKKKKYAKEMAIIEEEERKRAEREARRNAMARALKDPTVYGPRKSPNIPKLDTSGFDIAQGVAGMTGELASQAGQDFGEGGKYEDLFKRLKDRRQNNRSKLLDSDVGYA